MGEQEQATNSLLDSPDGFADFYQAVFSRALPRHARRDWIEPLYKAHKLKKGLVVEAFRGSSKTTTLSIAFAAFRIGLHPEQSTLLIQASDRAASDTAAQVADLIAHNPGWKKFFADIQPDRKMGWGSDGYEVVDKRIDYDQWRALCAQYKGKDPTLIGLGYKSRGIIGKHPTELLLIDDIHDESNTRSARELEWVIKTLTGTILPTVTPETWQIVVGTPWRENDALATLKATRRFVSVATPIRKNGVSQWGARFPKDEIQKLRELSGEAQFARMYMLDVKAAQGINLRAEWLNRFPFASVHPSWPVIMGVDYASTADQLNGRERDYFAVAIGRALPGSGIVVVDGYRGHVSQGEAEQKLMELAARYPTTKLIGIEAVGSGEEFFNLMQRIRGLPALVPMRPGGKSKGQRFEGGMAQLFERNKAWIADIETEFLSQFRNEWLGWPGARHDDTLDAVAYMLEVGENYVWGDFSRRKKGENPFTSFGRR